MVDPLVSKLSAVLQHMQLDANHTVALPKPLACQAGKDSKFAPSIAHLPPAFINMLNLLHTTV